MRVVVTFAVEPEFAPWMRMREFRAAATPGVKSWTARIGECDVRAGLTGIGQIPAVRATRALLADGADALISTGLAGGLRPEHRTGHVLVARAVRMAEEKFLIKSDTRLRRLAAVTGARVVERFFSAEHVVTTAREKAALGLVADAVEMESFAILTEAARWRVPGIAIRAISDPCAVDLPIDFNRVITVQGRLSLPRLIGQVARNPHRVRQLGWLATTSRRAAETLARFLDVYVTALADPLRAPETLFKVART